MNLKMSTQTYLVMSKAILAKSFLFVVQSFLSPLIELDEIFTSRNT